MPLQIVEYEDMIELPMGAGPVPKEPPLASTEVALSGTSQQHILNVRCRLVRLSTTEPCRILFGTNPTAVANVHGRLATDQTEFRGVNGSIFTKIAYIASA